ncbi:MAG TPA: FixH family protein [Polyangiaceae bacterium]
MPTLPLATHGRTRLSWALVPIALLVTSAVGVGTMAIVAARDPHFATEPDYYQKAIRWDQTQAQAATNQRLGYTMTMPASLKLDERGHATVALTLSDSFGRKVHGAQLVGKAFANAYSGQVVSLAFSEQSPGEYRAETSVRHAGLWVFEVTGDAGTEHFTANLRADLTPGGAQ